MLHYVEDRTLAVDIDIKPTSCPNPLKVKGNGVLPVTILGGENVDVSEIDPETIAVEGVSALRWEIDDVAEPYGDGLTDTPDREECWAKGPDGLVDLALKFDKQAIIDVPGSVEDGDVVVLTLTGNLMDGTPIEGQDVVWIIDRGAKK